MLRIRPATIDDAALLAAMVRELAEFEHELQWVTIRAEDLARDGFGTRPRFRALIAEWSGEPAAYALFFGYYSTWVGPGPVSGGSVRARSLPRPGDRNRHARRGRPRCRGRRLLRHSLGGSQLEPIGAR